MVNGKLALYRTLIALVLVLPWQMLVIAAPRNEPRVESSVGAATFEQLSLDTRIGQPGPVVSTQSLVAGVTYTIRVSGTWSAWYADKWSSYQGLPEDAPMLPSPGVTNGKVGIDAAYAFAVPGGYAICEGPAVFPCWLHKLEISLDGGLTWASANPIDNTYHPDHTYQYIVVGQGQPVQFRLLDPNFPGDNYGILSIDFSSVSRLVDDTTTGYYNDSLGTRLDGTQLQFPIDYRMPGGKDPTILRAREPDLTSVTDVLGVWLVPAPLPLNTHWSDLQAIPKSWAADRENAIIYPISVGPQGYSRVVGNFGVDNGLYVWVNGRYKFGAMEPGAVSGLEYTNIDLGSLPPGQNYIQILREDHGDFGGFTVLITGTATAAGAQITYPLENTKIPLGPLSLNANAWSNTGAGVKQVEFFVFYDRTWHPAGLDANPPYEVSWLPPAQLRAQILKVRVDVVDQVSGRAEIADVVGGLDYREDVYDPTGAILNWVPFRVYLNQRSLDDDYGDGDVKCGPASMAMVLAMDSLIDWDTATLQRSAKEMWLKVRTPKGADYNKMITELGNRGLNVDAYYGDAAGAWPKLKTQIDAGYPVILATKHGVVTRDGHFMVGVGYREKDGKHEVIAYDPFGEWTGSCCYPIRGYDANDKDDPLNLSRRGQWVYYDFDQIFRYPLITGTRPNTLAGLVGAAAIPSTPPDLVTDESVNLEAYAGTPDVGLLPLYLPLVRR